NYLANLGWSLDGETTIFTKEQAIAAFDLANVSKNPAAFDPEKLAWMNGEYIRAMAPERFDELIRPWIEKDLGRELEPDATDRIAPATPAAHERKRPRPDAGVPLKYVFPVRESKEPASS